MYGYGYRYSSRPNKGSLFPAPVAIGTFLENSTNWADFGTNWTESHGGGGTSTVTANKLVFSGGSGTMNDLIYQDTWITNLEVWEMEVTFTLDAYGNGLSLGTQGYSSTNDLQAFFQMSSGASFGFMRVYRGGTLLQSSVAGIAQASLGDSLTVNASMNTGVLTMTVTNNTTPATNNFAFNYVLTIGGNTPPAAGYFALYLNGGDMTLDTWDMTSTSQKNVEWLAVGDSQTQGIQANTYPNRWVNLWRAETSKTTNTLCSGGNTLEIMNLDYDEIDLVNAQKVLLMLGSNDIRNGASLATTQTRYSTFVTHLKNNGVTVAHQTPIADNTTDLSGLASWIISTYSMDEVSDIFDLTRDGATTNLNPTWDSGDGTHMNATGQAAQYVQLKIDVTGLT